MTIETKANAKTALGVVIACTIGNVVCLTATVSAVFGVFLVPISEDFGWQRSQVTAVLGIISLVSIIAFPIVGRLMDIYGGRKVLLVGNLFFALSVAAVSQVNNNLMNFYLLFALIGIAGAIPCTAMFSKVVSEWFDKRRGLMLGISAGVGNGVGATLMPIIAAILLGYMGWQMSYAVIGFLIFALGFPATYFLLKDAPRPVVTEATNPKYHPNAPSEALEGLTLTEALKSVPFWLIIASLGLGAGCLTAIFSHVIPVLTDRGQSLTIATTVMVVLALVTSGWQVAVGSLLDHIKSPRVAAPSFVVATIGLWLLETGSSTPLLILAGALLGVGLGTAFGALPYFISRYFGLKAYGVITGVIYSVVMLAQGVTPYLMDIWFDAHKAYFGSIVIIGICLLIVAGLIMLFPSYRIKVSAAEVASVNHGGL
ncbi:MFS transporter [Asticcacaulis machinosus]|uniref:MFS transporter n=1 Tax=Asticcacaulis machinosus TaxID=2984211 RepID=A0ABT5HFN5_9CAUL|nr:MFS transporter [Asticcacaulis machinosus]MDC7675064.1 MFS transporter [Asticcacaulis machinosus]